MIDKNKSYSFIVDGMKRENEVLLNKALATVQEINKVIVDSSKSMIQIFAHKGNRKDFELYINAAIKALELNNIKIRTHI